MTVTFGAAGALGWLTTSVASEVSSPRDLHDVAYATSAECQRCHQDHYASWHRTYHRTMTAEATGDTVLGDFDGAAVAYGGVTARFTRERGTFVVTFYEEGRAARRAEVERVVGSHRYQQLLARDDDLYVRLPVAWHVGEQRWFHMNGAFLTPDPVGLDTTIDRADYDRHVVRWNDNCIFCHNVAPNPGREGDRFESTVAELGIACEACHGPAEAHVALNSNPVRRYWLQLTGSDDPTMVSPADLDADRSAEVCGRCHGQRITDDIDRFHTDGDPYVPGDRLTDYSDPLWRDTALDGDPGPFALRFWRDGTPRLTAYEYQGMLLSPCAEGGEMTCASCHAMHEGDPAGQIRPSATGDAACTQCHTELGTPAALAAHTRHEPAGSGARCVACHMPPIVYGLVSIHRSHRVEVPDPAQHAADGRPDACTLCHIERTRAWAATELARGWPRDERTATEATSSPAEWPEVDRALLAGDPIERAVTASAIGDGRSARDHRRDAARLGILLDALRDDPYPAVRWITWRAGRALHPARVWDTYDPMAGPAAREVSVASIERALGPEAVEAPDAETVSQLRAQASRVAIEIGE